MTTKASSVTQKLVLILLVGLAWVPSKAQLVFTQGDDAPMQPFTPPSTADRAIAKKNHLKATLRFGYLSHDRAAESLRRRTEFNSEGYPITVYDFSPAGGVAAKKEYAYDPSGTQLRAATIEEYDTNGDLKLLLNYAWDEAGRISSYREQRGQAPARSASYLYNAENKLVLLQHIAPDGLPGGSESYTYGPGLTASMEKRDIADEVVERVTWTLDTKGRILAENRYLGGQPPVLLYSYRYEYDAKGRLVRKEKMSRDLVLSGWESWAYDNYGHVTEHQTLLTGEQKPIKETFKYDHTGKPIQHLTLNGDGSIFQWHRYAYDSLTTGAGMERLTPSGKVDYKHFQVFNKQRQLLEEIKVYTDGTGETKTVYRYQPDGLPLEEKFYESGHEEEVYWFVHERY